jgi:CDP-6-deoxy-D-xylo-4-hexulose-3-dehydrase
MGAIVTDDKNLAGLVRQIKANGRVCDCLECTRNQGICLHTPKDENDNDPRFTHNVIGYNFKTMEFQAALGLLQLSRLDEIINKRRENVRKLNEKLKNFSDILKLPVFDENVSYLAYPIIIKDNKIINRQTLRKKLSENGIETRPLFGCIPTQQPAYSFLKEKYKGKLPNAEYIGANGFYIGCHQYLKDKDINYIGDVFEKILNKG